MGKITKALGLAASLAALITFGYWCYDRYADPTFEISFAQAPQIQGHADITVATGEVSFRDPKVSAMAYIAELTNTSQKSLHVREVLLVPSGLDSGEVFSMNQWKPGATDGIAPGQAAEYRVILPQAKLEQLKQAGVVNFSVEVYTSAGLAKQLGGLDHLFEHKIGSRYHGGEFRSVEVNFTQ